MRIDVKKAATYIFGAEISDILKKIVINRTTVYVALLHSSSRADRPYARVITHRPHVRVQRNLAKNAPNLRTISALCHPLMYYYTNKLVAKSSLNLLCNVWKVFYNHYQVFSQCRAQTSTMKMLARETNSRYKTACIHTFTSQSTGTMSLRADKLTEQK